MTNCSATFTKKHEDKKFIACMCGAIGYTNYAVIYRRSNSTELQVDFLKINNLIVNNRLYFITKNSTITVAGFLVAESKNMVYYLVFLLSV